MEYLDDPAGVAIGADKLRGLQCDSGLPDRSRSLYRSPSGDSLFGSFLAFSAIVEVF
jgi:hypothetical protein